MTMWWDETKMVTEMEEAAGIRRVPTWPSQTLSEMLRLGFPPDCIIDSDNHAVMRQLRGYYD
jgi:hypothetical protein